MTFDLTAVVSEALKTGAFGSASWRVFQGDRVLSEGALGEPDVARPGQEALLDTVYDLASLTKPLATAPLVLKTLDAMGLTPQSPVADGGLVGPLVAGATFSDLLSHRAGLPSWLPLYGLDKNPEKAWQKLLQMTPGPRGQVQYGCPGYLLLGKWLQDQGLNLTDHTAPLSYTPLKKNPPVDTVYIAPTERGRHYETAMARDMGYEVDDASPVLPGEVHDGNGAFLGGVAGNAGLFGHVAQVHQRLLDLSAEQKVQALFQPLPGCHRSMGCVLASAPDSHAFGVLPETAVGHTGFTGTMFWLDQNSGWGTVLLTNRVHPTVGEGIEAERRLFLQAAWSLFAEGDQ